MPALDELELLAGPRMERVRHPHPRQIAQIRSHHAQSTSRSNGRLEGLNSQIRLITHRSFGFHSAAPLIALIYLCCTHTTIDLPR